MHKEMNEEGWMMHKRMLGAKTLIIGILILANIYFIGLSWPIFAGAVLILFGIGSLIMPGCCGKHHRRR